MLFNDNTFWRFFNPFAINQKDIQLIVVGCFFALILKKMRKLIYIIFRCLYLT